jgi:hypothetical protein
MRVRQAETQNLWLFVLFFLVHEDERLSASEDQRQFVRKPLPVVQDFRAVFFLFFPVVGEFHGTPVRDVAIFSLAENPVEHSRRAEQPDVAAMQRRERAASDITLLGKKDSTGFTIGRGIEQQILNFIQQNACVGEDARPRRWDIVGYCRVVGQISESRFPGQDL